MSTTDAQIRAALDAMRQDLAEQQRQHEVSCFVDGLERVHDGQTKLITAMMRDVNADLEREFRQKRLEHDGGLYYKYISSDEAKTRLHPATWKETHEVLAECTGRIGLVRSTPIHSLVQTRLRSCSREIS